MFISALCTPLIRPIVHNLPPTLSASMQGASASAPMLSTTMLDPGQTGRRLDRLGHAVDPDHHRDVEPVRLELFELVGRARGADHPGADEFPQHQRRGADAGRRRGHQQGLALVKLAAGEEPVMHDDKDHRNRRRLGPVERRRRRHHLARVEEREFGEPAGAAAHHPVAFLDAGDARADLDNLARGIAAAGARLGRRLPRFQPQRMQPAELGAVDRRCVHPHQHLARPDDRPLRAAHAQPPPWRTRRHMVAAFIERLPISRSAAGWRVIAMQAAMPSTRPNAMAGAARHVDARGGAGSRGSCPHARVPARSGDGKPPHQHDRGPRRSSSCRTIWRRIVASCWLRNLVDTRVKAREPMDRCITGHDHGENLGQMDASIEDIRAVLADKCGN